MRIGDILTLDEVRISGNGIAVSAGPNRDVQIAELTATVIVTESALNRFLLGRSEDQLRDLQVRMLAGKVRIEGRYGVVPFTFTAVPEIEGGARLRLDPRQMSLVGLPVPGIGAQVIGERLNTQLARILDVTRLGIPVRLTGITMETGRMILAGSASLNIRPPGSDSGS